MTGRSLAAFLSGKHEVQVKRNKEQQIQIRQLFREGNSREQIFLRLCKNLPNVCVYEVTECFERVEKNLEIAYKFEESHKELFAMILAENEKIQNAIIEWTEPLYEVTLLNSRYAISTSMDDLKQDFIYLLDNFYGQKRPIEIQGIDFKDTEEYYFEVIDLNHLLLFQCSQDNNWFVIHLMQFDFNEAKCIQLASEMLGGYFGKAFIDRQDCYKFVVWFGVPGQHNGYLCLGHVEDSKLIMESQVIEFIHRPICARLVGNVLQMFVAGNMREGEEDVFGEFLLESGKDNPPMRKLFQVPRRHFSSTRMPHCWTGDVCYFANSGYTAGKCHVMKLDLEQQDISATKYNFYGGCSIEDMFVDDEEQQLTFLVEHRLDDTCIAYRFPLNPDTLNNSVLFKLRRECIFHGREFPKLPNSMRPFEICPL